MRGHFIKIVAASFAAIAPLASAATAEDRDCSGCGPAHSGYHSWPGPRVIDVRNPDAGGQGDFYARRYIVQTVPTELLDPSDARAPVYFVNQGGRYIHAHAHGAHTYAVPTYSEGGYAYVGAYPYGAGHHYGHDRPHGSHGGAVYQLGYRPYSSYSYRVPPSARVIQIGPAPGAATPAPAPQRTAPAR